MDSTTGSCGPVSRLSQTATTLAASFFLLSGFSALVYQIVWVRMFSVVFGVTVLAVSTVVAAFMAGLGLGSIYFGRRADRHPRPLMLYGLLEIGIGLLAAAWLLPSSLFGPNASEMAAVGQRLLYYHDGVQGSLMVVQDVERAYKTLSVNGHVTAWTTPEDIRVHKMLAHMPMALHEDPRGVLIIGFGLGVTARSAIEAGAERVDCMELMPGEVQTARFFADVNGDVLADPRLRLMIGDGRNHVLATERTYDVISSNAVYPEFSPSLYTREFYELCRARLNRGGVMCVWLPTNLRTFRVGLRTFQSVFPHATLWYCNGGHTVVVGTVEPSLIDLRRLSRRLADPATHADLAGTHLEDPYVFVTSLMLSESGLRTYTGKAAVHTDDFPIMEFHITPVEEMAALGIRNVVEALDVPVRVEEVMAGDGMAAMQQYSDASRAIMRFKTYLWYGSNVQGQQALAGLQGVGDNFPRLRPLLTH